MTIPKTIVTKEQWERYKREKNLTNNGVTGWFPDAYGILHFYQNIKQPTEQDKRLVDMNRHQQMEYFRSEFVVLPPPHLLTNPDDTFKEGKFAIN